MKNVSVTWDGEGIFATIPVALATAQTAQAMACAILRLTSVLVKKAGLEVAAKSQTVQGPLTAFNAEYATPLQIPLSVKTASRGGWDRLATILVQTVNKSQWIAVTAFVKQAGSVSDVIANVLSMERLSMRCVSVT